MTLMGGQAFNFDYNEDEKTYFGFTQSRIIEIKLGDNKNDIFWQTYPEKDDFAFIKQYLRLDVDYKKVLKEIQKDKYIKASIKKYPDLRILKQDFDQTVLSYLISANNNIRSIRKTVRSLSKEFGRKIQIKNKEFFLFPETQKIADAKLESLLECKLGFRAKFLKNAAKHLSEKDLSRKILKLPENKARECLTSIKGIGEKISDCVLVFSLSFDNITPLDVWGKRVLVNYYGLDPKMKYEEMRLWIKSYFGKHASWAGQFLFEYIRNK